MLKATSITSGSKPGKTYLSPSGLLQRVRAGRLRYHAVFRGIDGYKSHEFQTPGHLQITTMPPWVSLVLLLGFPREVKLGNPK